MKFSRFRIATLFLTLSLGFLLVSGCNKSSKTPVAGSSAVAPVRATPDAQGVPKCPNGSDPVKKEGLCKGTWHALKDKSPKGGMTNYCEFAWTSPISCKSEGFADDGRGFCYGPPYRIEAGAKALTESECASRYGTPPNGAQYQLSCCSQ